MKGRKNDFSVTFYDGENRRLFMEYVHDTRKAVRWVESQKIKWTHGNVYERRTREFITRIYPDTALER